MRVTMRLPVGDAFVTREHWVDPATVWHIQPGGPSTCSIFGAFGWLNVEHDFETMVAKLEAARAGAAAAKP